MRLCEEVLGSAGLAAGIDARRLPALTLAFVGDTLCDLYVRTMLIERHALPVHDLHVKASERVNAGAQARAAHTLMEAFTSEELVIYKRGRNAKSHTIPKNANMSDYRAATGLEAVLGYLYLSGREPRAFELLALAFAGPWAPQEKEG